MIAKEDAELLDLVEMELRELLSKYKFPGDDDADHPRQRRSRRSRATRASWASRRS